jgi:hypothetical protein
MNLFSLAYSSDFDDSVSLKNGSFIKGKVVQLSLEEKIKIETSDSSIFIYSLPEIEKISVTADSVLLKNGSLLKNRLIEIIPGKSISSISPDGSSLFFDISEVTKIVLKNYDIQNISQSVSSDLIIRESKPDVGLKSQSVSDRQNRLSFLLFGGGAFGHQSVEAVIDESEIKSGIGFHAGAGIQYSKYWFTITYLKTKHAYNIKEEKVTLNFSDFIFGVGLNLSKGKTVTPYIQAIFALPNLKDKESDGFKGGKTFGLGAGLKFWVSDHIFVGFSGIYGINTYAKFEVKEVSSVNDKNVEGNYLLLLGNIGYKFNLK